MGNPSALSLGAGTLKNALIGTAEPTDLVTAWPAGWVDLGYTHEGSDFSYELETEPVEVAEELDRVSTEPTGRIIMVKFVLAEITATNLKKSLNGGTITSGSGFVTFEPPAIDAITKYMYGWQSRDAQERWVFRQCLSGGTVEINRRKGADKAGIAFELFCEKPAGVTPFKAIFVSPGRA